MLLLNKRGCEVSKNGNDIDFVLFSDATSVGSPHITIYINSAIVDAANHIWLKKNISTQ